MSKEVFNINSCKMAERSEQEQIRFEKLAALRQQGFGYPNDARPNATSKVIQALDIGEQPDQEKKYHLAGRLVLLRKMGKAAFAHILDVDGKVQIYVRKDDVGEPAYEAFKHFDLGDIIEVKGWVFLTKTGEKTLHAESVRLLVKGLIPPPEKFHGLSDVELRYRQRYLDLIVNEDSRSIFRARAKIISHIRGFLDSRNYLEVETPVLHHLAGGADARPFKTHHNALDQDMYLRIALELPLKKLVVGGLERVYELSRVFRNEGLSRKHNPEFTMLEFYQAYARFDELMDMTEELFCELAQLIHGRLSIAWGEETIDFTPPWPRISMENSLYEIAGVARSYDVRSLEDLLKIAAERNVELDSAIVADWGQVLEKLWDELVEDKLRRPTFITHHPASISPLARKNDDRPEITDRFELIVAGVEMANGFSELNDPEDQRARFEEQARAKGLPLDEEYIRALEYGLPPTGGEGIGVDRLVMLLTNSPAIRDVVLFPQLKREV
jgi:lysyl-tRNA synthetase class 2